MKSLSKYIASYGNLSFQEKKFTDIDAMILVQLSYLNFERILLKDFCHVKDLASKAEELTKGNYAVHRNKELLRLVTQSIRYQTVEVGEVECVLNDSIQFGAMTFRIQDSYHIVFRGTDMSIAGWKEDFFLGVNETIDSHPLGLQYATNILDKYQGSFYLSGHSKGGNIALYVGMHLDKDNQNKIVKILDFDGPGFTFDLIKEPSYLTIKHRYFKFVPKDDIIGLLLNHSDEYQVVDSKSIGFFQHDLYFWKIRDDAFVKLDDTSVLSKIFNKTLLDWLDSMSIQERYNCVIAADDFFKKANITDLNQIKKLSFKTTKDLISSSLHLPFQQKKMLACLMLKMMKYYIKNSVKQIHSKEDKDLEE
ncbi:MAG: DUF2974 domain-containing protein [Anaeroplasmataceae bacterium]|nr:DUF2974 domain-containing protein [Anaeroplasmataceae bacterium]